MAKRKSIKDFLTAVSNHGVAVKSLFEVSITPAVDPAVAMTSLLFYVTDIDLPGKKLTTSTLYRDGREYDVPIIYDNNREFSMTVLCDAVFSYYETFSKLMSAGKFGEPGGFTIKIVPTTKLSSSPQRIIELQHVFFESLGPIQFSHNSKTELITFTVMGRFRDVIFDIERPATNSQNFRSREFLDPEHFNI